MEILSGGACAPAGRNAMSGISISRRDELKAAAAVNVENTMTEFEYKPTQNSVRKIRRIQGIVRRPDGTFIRPVALLGPLEELPKTNEEAKSMLLKLYSDVANSTLIKAWLEITTITADTIWGGELKFKCRDSEL